ncbi:hypothetical protein FQZ97_1030160 [compost metagenome]
MRLVEAVVLAIGAQYVNQLVALAERILRRQRAIPFRLADRRHVHGNSGDRLDQVPVAAAIQGDFQTLDESRIVATHVELHRLGDAFAIECHHGRRRNRQFGLAERGIFGRPDNAATGEVDGELAYGRRLARLLHRDRDAAFRLQGLR